MNHLASWWNALISFLVFLTFVACILWNVESATVTIPWYDGVPYDDASAVVPVGTAVSWVWSDSLFHTVTGMDASSNLFQGPGGGYNVVGPPFVYNFTFEATGNYSYFCAPHADSMRGIIVVIPASDPVTIRWRVEISVEEASVTIPVGTVVRWIWSDRFLHSVRDLNSSRNSFQGIGGGNNFTSPPFTYEYVFSRVGNYSYECRVFPSMKGVISVVLLGASESPSISEPPTNLVLISRPPFSKPELPGFDTPVAPPNEPPPFYNPDSNGSSRPVLPIFQNLTSESPPFQVANLDRPRPVLPIFENSTSDP